MSDIVRELKKIFSLKLNQTDEFFFLMLSDFLRRTPPRPDEIASQTPLEDIVKGMDCSFSVLSMVADNRKYRKNRKLIEKQPF